jgi:hypothetical protein
MASFGGLAFSMTYNFNQLNVKGCTANTAQRRTNDFSSNEEQFFWRLCAVKTEGFQTFTTYDFRNLMVTATDIQIVPEYRNPVVSGASDVTVKFVESCGFLWSERDWKVTSYFKFMRADQVCGLVVGSTNTEGTYEAGIGHNSVNYVMYEASLIKYFMDDSDYTSTVHFNANPISASTPNVYRMCLYAQAVNVGSLDANKWIDYPHVALFPVSEHVKLSARSNLWQTVPVETNCPKGWLGCACNTSNFCEANFHRALDSGVGSVQASCNTGTGIDSFCEAPTRVLFGQPAAYSSSPRIVCSVPTPCSNPGPAIQGGGLAMRFSSNDLAGGTDIIRFVQSTTDCVAGSDLPGGSYTNVLPNVVTGNLVQNWGGNLNAFYYRLCVGDSNGLYAKDYFSTGFAVTNQGSSAPTRRTLRPTTALNKGHAITMAPTKANPVFGGPGRFPENPQNYNTLVPSNQDFLYITQENTDSNPLYTQLTNFTYQDLVASDSLRVYRTLPFHNAYSNDGIKICTPSWAVQQEYQVNNLVMELKISQTVTASAVSHAKSVSFPPLAKGFYTVCFCRKTVSNRCQMKSAGMIYSSAARMVSIAGSGSAGSSFQITPLLEYEIDSNLFNTTRYTGRYITANHFCLSNATQNCANCRNFQNEFTIELTNGGFPLKITNLVAHALGNEDKVYNLCFKDPMLPQWDVINNKNASAIRAEYYDLNNTMWSDQWSFAKIGSVFLTDLSFQWEVDGGFGPARNTYSVTRESSSTVVMTYANSDLVIKQTDTFWFSASAGTCESSTNAKTANGIVPATGSKVRISTASIAAGHFYRLCVCPVAQNCNANYPARDFGIDYGFYVTDITASANVLHFFKAFHLSLSTTTGASLVDGDNFYLYHIAIENCASILDDTNKLNLAGLASPNMVVWRSQTPAGVYNLGKMPQKFTPAADLNPQFHLAGYRLCVKRTDPATALSTYYDYAGLHFWPMGSFYPDQTRVPKNYKTTVSFMYSNAAGVLDYQKALFAADVVWFNRIDTVCAPNNWVNNQYVGRPTGVSSHSTGSAQITISSSNYVSLSTQLELDFGQTTVTSIPFRMCVQRKSWVTGAQDGTGALVNSAVTQDIVQDYSNVQLYVSDFDTTTKAPTSLAQANTAPTPKSSIVLPSFQSFTVLADSATPPSLTWKFTSGKVVPTADKIAVVPYAAASRSCDGSTNFANPILLLPAAAGSTAVESTATTPVFGAIGVGRYYVCFCQASTSITGDCSTELGWKQTVGYLHSFAIQAKDFAVNKLTTTVPTQLTVWFDQVVDANMRFMLLKQDQTCGVDVRTISDQWPGDFFLSTAKETTTAALSTGLTISSSSVQTSSVGVYQMCFCSVQPCYDTSPNGWGGPVSTFIVHDIQLNGQLTPVIVHQSDGNGTNFTITQSVFDPKTDKIWFSRDSCGDGSHVAAAGNLTAVQSLPVSGNNVYVDHSLMQANMISNKLCVQRNQANATSVVYTFDSVGFVLTDVNVTQINNDPTNPNNPKYQSTSESVGITWKYGLQALDSANLGNRVMYFMDTTQDCGRACIGQVSTCQVTQGTYNTDSQAVNSGSGGQFTYNFGSVASGKALRLCVLLDSSAAEPRSFIDFSSLRLYPVTDNTNSYSKNGAVFAQTGYETYLTGVSSNSAFTTQSSLFFRRQDKSCGTAAPTEGDAFTSGPFVYSYQAMSVDFSKLNATQSAFRLCVQTKTSSNSITMLDYSTKTVYLTAVTLVTTTCMTGLSCSVAITAPEKDGFFFIGSGYANSVAVWFERTTANNGACARSVPGSPSNDGSGSGLLTSRNGTVSLSFASVTASTTAALRMCAYNSQQKKYADFPSLQLYVVDVQLSASYNDINRPLTKWVTPSKATAVNLKSATSLQNGAVTWFQKSSQSCTAAPTASTADNTDAVTVTSSLVNGLGLVFDFSLVQPVGSEQVPFRLCFQAAQSQTVISADTVTVHVIEFSVKPGYVGKSVTELVEVSPGTEVNINYFAFCRSDAPCSVQATPTKNCSGYALYQKNAAVAVDFSTVESNGKLLRLCGYRQSYDTADRTVDLAPKGVYQGLLSLDRNIANYANTSVTVTWSSVLNGTAASVWFTSVTSDCASVSAAKTNKVKVMPSPFQGSFGFSSFPKTVTDVKICADVDGSVSTYAETGLSLLSASLGATSVTAVKDQKFTVTYSDLSSALGSSSATVTATMSSDATCQTAASATPAVTSVSGAVHSFDFSSATASASKWVLCLNGNGRSVPIDWVSVVVVDVGSLGKNEVANAADQKLKLDSSVSLAKDDLVWFSSAGVCSSGGATDSNQQQFTGTADYLFDFSKATTSLSAAYKMCVSRSGATMQYSSSSVLVVPEATLGGPYMTGPRAIDVSSLINFLGAADIAFVLSTDPCSGGQYVNTSAVTFPLATAGTYRMCVKTASATVDLSSVTVVAKACGDFCPTSNAGGCDEAKGTCKACTSHFTGDMCTACAPGYSGAGCTACDSAMDFVCAAPAADGSCPLSSTCGLCGCSGNFDPKATARCPGGVCNCLEGFAAPTCASCQVGYYQLETNATSGAFTCNNCADKCFKRASSCDADKCVCNNNFDPATSCEYCKAGHVLNGTACVATVGPTTVPTSAPTSVPTKAPTGAPTPNPCDLKVDTWLNKSECENWANSDNKAEGSYCNQGNHQFYDFVSSQCEKTCCQQKTSVAAIGLATHSEWYFWKPATVVNIETDAKCEGWFSWCGNNDYVNENCQKTCSTLPPIAGSIATDVANTLQCEKWRGFCTTNTYVLANCGLTCSSTRSLWTGSTNVCSNAPDTNSRCDDYAYDDWCFRDNDWMKNNCQRTCCRQAALPYCANGTPAADTRDDCATFVTDTKGGCAVNKYFAWFRQNCATTCCN